MKKTGEMGSALVNLGTAGILAYSSMTCTFNLKAKPACDDSLGAALVNPTPARGECLSPAAVTGLSVGVIWGMGAALPCLAVGLGDAAAVFRRRREEKENAARIAAIEKERQAKEREWKEREEAMRQLRESLEKVRKTVEAYQSARRSDAPKP
jgi:Sec-independent protein translocase protein TatA